MERRARTARCFIGYISCNDPSIFQVGNEHRLHEERLRGIAAQILSNLSECMKEIVQQDAIDALRRIEKAIVLLPEAS